MINIELECCIKILNFYICQQFFHLNSFVNYKFLVLAKLITAL